MAVGNRDGPAIGREAALVAVDANGPKRSMWFAATAGTLSAQTVGGRRSGGVEHVQARRRFIGGAEVTSGRRRAAEFSQ